MTRRTERVLYLSTSVLPSLDANSIAVVRMCDALTEAGCSVDLVGRRGPDDVDMAEHYAIDGDLRIHRSTTRGPVWTRRGALLATSWRKVPRRAPQVVYSRDAVLLLMGSRPGAATVYEVHHPPGPTLARAEALLYRTRPPTLTVFISQALRDHYLELREGLRPDRCLVAPSGARVGSGASAASGEPIIGYVGHVAPGRTDLLGEIARRLPHRVFHVYGRREGTGDDWPPNLRYHGSVAPRQVPGALDGLDICLAPYTATASSTGGSPTARWMSPLKVLEYMGHGRAVVASDLPAIREIVRPGVDAEVCPPDDPNAWAATIEELCSDRDRRHRLGAAARRTVDEHYSWSVRARRVLEALARA